MKIIPVNKYILEVLSTKNKSIDQKPMQTIFVAYEKANGLVEHASLKLTPRAV